MIFYKVSTTYALGIIMQNEINVNLTILLYYRKKR